MQRSVTNIDHSGRSAQGRALLVRAGLLAAFAFILAMNSLVAAEPAAVLPEVDLQIDPNRSVFISDPTFGKDPFYPHSKRREGLIPKITTPELPKTNLVHSSTADFSNLHLKGISTPGGRKYALINRYTFAEGEEQKMKVNNQVILVRCEKINENSVVVRIKDSTKELFYAKDSLNKE